LFVLVAKDVFLLRMTRTLQILFLFLTVVIAGILLSPSPLLGWYGFVKLLEFSFFAWYTATYSNYLKNPKPIVSIFAISVVVESLLAITQYIHQSSTGLLYVLGERTFTSSTPGIANANVSGQLILRPYATFPHPNVLAGFLCIALIIIIANVSVFSKKAKLFLTSAIGIGSIALLLTLSRSAIIVFCLLGIILLLLRLKRIKNLLVIFIIILSSFIIILFTTPLMSRFVIRSNDESVVVREQLTNASLAMIKTHPLVGVGLNNFLVALPKYLPMQTVFSIQPVHNIFLLVLSQIGAIGFAFFVSLLFFAIRHALQVFKTRPEVVVSLIAILLLGMVDHYFLTLQQGQLLFAFVLGLCFTCSPKFFETKKQGDTFYEKS